MIKLMCWWWSYRQWKTHNNFLKWLELYPKKYKDRIKYKIEVTKQPLFDGCNISFSIVKVHDVTQA